MADYAEEQAKELGAHAVVGAALGGLTGHSTAAAAVTPNLMAAHAGQNATAALVNGQGVAAAAQAAVAPVTTAVSTAGSVATGVASTATAAVGTVATGVTTATAAAVATTAAVATALAPFAIVGGLIWGAVSLLED